MPLTRKKQIATAIETVPGVLESGLLGASNATVVTRDVTGDLDIEYFDRNLQRDSLTPGTQIAGIKTGSISFTVDLAGHGIPPTVPDYDKLLRACGFSSVVTTDATLTSITGGPFRHGEVITGGTSGETAIVLHDTYGDGSGNGTMYVHTASGAFTAAETITGGTTGATATISADFAALGHSWYPISTTTYTLTYGTLTGAISTNDILIGDVTKTTAIVLSHDTVAKTIVVRSFNGAFTASDTQIGVVGSVGTNNVDFVSYVPTDIPTLSIAVLEDGVAKLFKGCRGTVSFNATLGQAFEMTFTFSGVVDSCQDTANISGVTTTSATPPTVIGLDFYLGKEGDTEEPTYCPRANAFTLDIGNNLSARRDFCQTAGVTAFEITERNGSGTLDPELDLEASYPILDCIKTGGLGFFHATHGETVGNQFYMSSPGMQFTGAPSGDRDGTATRDWNFNLTGGQQTNAANSDGFDNEFVLTYIAQ